MFRAGVRALLESYPDIQIIGEACDGNESIEMILKANPDVAIMDISMPKMDGLTATRLLKEANPNLKLLFLTQHENKEYIVPALKLGAEGYILKRAASDELVHAIRKIAQGNKYLDAAVTSAVLDAMSNPFDNSKDAYEDLTGKEKEVLLNIAKGKTNKEIGESMHISIKTVEHHRANMMRKLGLKNLVELTRYAIKKGIIE
ncbi:DNA-binding response regulator [Desulfuribacillus stibiiarsenatis]|uniref:DNA-binding response regulator n=2 Tax=Desulfuribacillus stibiiarsenatis TaxID=1390249 RepID=A0A1E5L4P6_9FIRM|nr:DNA-binding response regulator [Desulfuribacillus stibiiarsenatis]